MIMDFPPPVEEQEALSNDEAHDQLGDLPFNGGKGTRAAQGDATAHTVPVPSPAKAHNPQHTTCHVGNTAALLSRVVTHGA